MAEPKPLASLSAGLLARKGAARPAMRRQMQFPTPDASGFGQDDLGWNDMGYDVDPQDGPEPARAGTAGLSPMPVTAEAEQEMTAAILASPVVEPIAPHGAVPDRAEPPAVRRHMERLEEEMAAPAASVSVEAVSPVEAVAPAPAARKVTSARKTAARSRPGARGSFAFTLRLDPDRHLRLRLASAAANRSAQQILTGLLDEFLAEQPEIAAFASTLPGAKDRR